ncbi:MAG: Wzz/FepE/Etk N-terminal domain-containing protein [Rhizomicrobium sp.]
MSDVDKSLLQPVYDFARILSGLVSAAVRRWPIVLFTIVLALLGAIAVGRFSKPQYASEMLVMAAPAQQFGSPNPLGALTSARSSFAALGLGSFGGSSQFKSFVQLVQSPAVAETLMGKPDDMLWLMGPSVDVRTGLYKTGAGPLRRTLYGLFNLSPPVRASVQDVQVALNHTVVISLSTDNPDIATISCTSTYAEACPKLLLDVHAATEAHLSAITASDARRLANYIIKVLPTVQEQVVRDSLVDLLASATKQIAMSDLHQSVGAVIISPPFPPGRPAFPRPGLLLAIGVAAGLFLGTMLAWILPVMRFEGRVSQTVRSLRTRFAGLFA